MEFKLSNLLPKAWRPDARAVEDFMKNKGGKDKDISRKLTKRRSFAVNMQQDELKVAVEIAKDPERPRRDMLYAFYEDVWENDGHTIGETRKCILKVIGSPFALFKKGTDEIDEKATRLLQRKWFEDMRKHFHEAAFWGFSLVQVTEFKDSDEEGVQREIKKVKLIDREHVRPEEGYIVIDVSHEVGIPFRDEAIRKQFILFEMGEPKYLGLLRVAAKEYIWKNYARSDWSRHSEKFGSPFLSIKTDTTNEKELDKIEQMAESFGHSLYYIGSSEDEIEIKEATFKDSFQIYERLAQFCNQEVSKAISGATGTSEEKAYVGGAEVHERILNEFIEAHKRIETYYINEEVLPMLIELGYPVKDLEYKYLSYQEADPEATQDKEEDHEGAGGSPAKKSQPPVKGGKGQRHTSFRALLK
jgi:phage gp29-like protein